MIFLHLQTSLDRSRKISYYNLVLKVVKKLREEIKIKKRIKKIKGFVNDLRKKKE